MIMKTQKHTDNDAFERCGAASENLVSERGGIKTLR